MDISLDLIERLFEVPADTPRTAVLNQNPQLRERADHPRTGQPGQPSGRKTSVAPGTPAQIVEWLSDLSADDFCRARALRCFGNIQVLQSNYQQSVLYFEHSLQLFERFGDDAEISAALSSLVQPLMYLGNYGEALRYAKRAKQIATLLGDELLLARLNINFGNVLHRQDRFADAVESYEAALGSLSRLGQRRDCAVAFLNLAVCHISLNDFKAAEAAYCQARLVAEDEKMTAITAQADYNIAYLHYYRGEYGKAIELYQKTRAYCRTSGDDLHIALCDLDQAEVYLDLHLHEEATALAKQAQAAFNVLGMSYEATKSMVWLGVAAFQSGKSFRALELLTTAREQMKAEGNGPWTATLDLYKALLMQQEGRYYEALKHCQSAQLILKCGSYKAVHADIISASLQMDLERETEASNALNKAIASAEKLQSSHLLCHAYTVLGRLQEAQNLLPNALSFSRLAQLPGKNTDAAKRRKIQNSLY